MPSTAGGPQTLYDKILADHIVDEKLDGTILLYIGRLNSESIHFAIPLFANPLVVQTDILSTKSHLL